MRSGDLGAAFSCTWGIITNSRRGILAGRSIFAAAAAAVSFFGWGESFNAAEKVLYSSAVMVRKKWSFLGAAEGSPLRGAAAKGGCGVDAGAVWFPALGLN